MIDENRSISIIGSFRQHYKRVQEIRKIFTDNGIEVLSPKGASIEKKKIPFVRFTSDNPNYDDCSVQSLTLHKLFSSTAIYVVAPNGYIGKTTAYEIGRLIQAQKPLFFSSPPNDLPLEIPKDHILSPEDLISLIIDPNWEPVPIFTDGDCFHYQLERELINGLLSTGFHKSNPSFRSNFSTV
jgi:hypothetical protein